MKKGITVAGNILVDKINVINAFPSSGELTQIRSVSKAAGGCVPNVAIDLKKLDCDLPVYASGKIGADEDGAFVKGLLLNEGIDVSAVIESPSEKTSFTDVMSVSGGERTFFTYAGASADYGVEDFLISEPSEFLHLGYFLLMDKMDNGDGLKTLKKAKELGVKTSIDLVSENSDRYSEIVPCLKYTDNLIINEIEAAKLANVKPDKNNIRAVAEKLKEFGVRERVIIHMPEKGVCLSENGYFEKPSLELPQGFIKGSTGAGDAFCAGALYGIYKGYSDERILEFSSCAAAASLRSADATSGVVSEKEINRLFENFKRKKV